MKEISCCLDVPCVRKFYRLIVQPWLIHQVYLGSNCFVTYIEIATSESLWFYLVYDTNQETRLGQHPIVSGLAGQDQPRP